MIASSQYWWRRGWQRYCWRPGVKVVVWCNLTGCCWGYRRRRQPSCTSNSSRVCKSMRGHDLEHKSDINVFINISTAWKLFESTPGTVLLDLRWRWMEWFVLRVLRPCFVRPDEGQTLKDACSSNNKQHQSPMLIHLSFLLVQTRILPWLGYSYRLWDDAGTLQQVVMANSLLMWAKVLELIQSYLP